MAERHIVLVAGSFFLSFPLLSSLLVSLAKLKPHWSIILVSGGPIATPLIAHPLFLRDSFHLCLLCPHIGLQVTVASMSLPG